VTFSKVSLRKSLLPLIASLLLSVSSGGSESIPSSIQVELDGKIPLLLHVTVRSHAESKVTFPKYRLPWGNRTSMLFVPVNLEGQCIDNKFFPIDDPSYEKISLEPNGSISGDVDLQRFVPGLDKALRKSDVHLFWAYQAPKELNIAQWSGGWILIPQQK
jgi:hypothetical protein